MPTKTTHSASKASKPKSKKSASKPTISEGTNEVAAAPAPEVPAESANGSQGGEKVEKAEKEYMKEVSRRLKKQGKKMDNIKRSEDKIKDLTEEEQAITILINADERSKIAGKPITSAVFKELNEIHDVLKKVAETEDKRVEEEKAEAEAKFAKAVAEAREQGRQEGLEEATAKILTVVRFLRLAGYRRQAKSGNDQEDDAIERILVLVYGGDQSAVDVCMKLANGSDEKIDDFDVTYSQIKDTATNLRVMGEEEPAEELEPEHEDIKVESEEINPNTQLPTEDSHNEDPSGNNVQPEVVEEDVPPPQTYANGEVEAPTSVLASSITADDAANEKTNTVETVEATPEVSEAVAANETSPETTDPVAADPVAADPVAADPVAASDVPTMDTGSWADEEVNAPEAATETSPENKEFQNVERRAGRGRGGYRGGPRGEFRGYRGRGGHRGDRGGEYRGRGGGEYRGRGDGDFRPRGDGEYRGRGDGEYREYRGRGDGEYRGRGDGEYRGRGDGEYRGRGGYRGNRERGDGENRGGYRGRGRGDHHHHQGGQQQQYQESQPPAVISN
ncbi:hypothetical protein DFP73DRAFT_528218 [Morchella snyderi]|nr:hypothetical protein DFP73DRAFT_528218 [Morchella snyderi]